MNYLVHLYLSDPHALCRLGNLMGDYVKGPLARHSYPDLVLRGLRQHRAVDSLSLAHDAVRRSKGRLDGRFGHTKGILIDIFYDHLLATHWSDWATGSFRQFVSQTYDLLKSHGALLPESFQPVARRIIRYDLLAAYQDSQTIRRVLERMAGRLSRPNLLAQGYRELERCGADMAGDCHDFLKDARRMLNKGLGDDNAYR